MSDKLNDLALDQLFRAARTRNGWTDRPVTEQQLRELYELVKLGPTSGNCCPARFVWVRSAEAKKKLASSAAPNNAPKILAAPVTVIREAAAEGMGTAHINLVYTRVLSPIPGRSSRSAVTEGALVTANQTTALATVQQIDTVYVDVTQPSSTLLRLKREAAAGQLQQNNAGQTPVRLRLEDGSDYTETGTLQFSEVTVDEGTGSVTIRASFPNPQRLLLPGMFVREEIEEGVQRDALLVPQLGISHNQKGEATALVVGSDNVVQLRTLEADRAVGDKWLVTDGLKPGDRVIIEGLQVAQPGSKVNPQEYQSTEAPSSAPPRMHQGNASVQPN